MNTKPAARRTRRCLECGADAVPIVYGLPGVELMEASDRGEVALGGCIIMDDQPTWQCLHCGHSFGTRRRRTGS